MIEQWQILEPVSGVVKHCVFSLAGRGNSCRHMQSIVEEMQLPDTLIVALRPFRFAWYPQPISAMNQDDTVKGLPLARAAIRAAIDKVHKGWSLPLRQIAVLGFSAGGVMAVQTAMHFSMPLAACVCIAGAVFEPNKIPKAKKQSTPIMLLHSRDDMCFEWNERYLPMRNGLESKGYNVKRYEKDYGGHDVYRSDIFQISHFLAKQFGYPDWTHPEIIRRQFAAMEEEE